MRPSSTRAILSYEHSTYFMFPLAQPRSHAGCLTSSEADGRLKTTLHPGPQVKVSRNGDVQLNLGLLSTHEAWPVNAPLAVYPSINLSRLYAIAQLRSADFAGTEEQDF